MASANFNNSPESEVLKEYLPSICHAISDLSVITQLADDLWAAKIIPTGAKVVSSSLPPYDHAHRIITAARVSVEQDPSLFHVVTEKLGDQGLRPLAGQMNRRLEGKQSLLS